MRKLIVFNLFFIILFLLFGCGIPSYKIVKPPGVITGDTTSVGFIAPSEDEDIYSYQIYYKIYNSTDDAILDDRDAIQAENTSKFGDTLIKELGGFQQFNIGSGDEENAQTLIPLNLYTSQINGGDLLFISFIGDGLIILAPQNSSDPSNWIIFGIPLRNVIDRDTGYYKTFSDNVDSDDSDRNGVTEFDNTYTISFVAFSSVFDIIGTSEDSIPVFLGSIEKSNL